MKTVIEMARQSGYGDHMSVLHAPTLERFAKLVRADERNSWPAEMEAMERQVNILTDALAQAKVDEREACAKVCEELAEKEWADNERCAAAIRASRTHDL